MKRIVLLFFFIGIVSVVLLPINAKAAAPKDVFYYNYFMYGQKKLFSKGEFVWNSDSRMPGELQFLGFGRVMPHSRTIYTGGFLAQLNFSVLFPAKVKIQDTLSARVQGYLVHAYVLGYDFLCNNENMDLCLYGGFEAGRLRMVAADVDLRNPMFSPMLMIDFRFRLRRKVLGIQLGLNVDVSSSKWKALHFGNKGNAELPVLRQSGGHLGISF
jgi:hypothetical protein